MLLAPRPATAALALAAIAATAFAPAPSEVETVAGTVAIDGVAVTYYLDDDPTSDQPVVLELLDDVTDAGEAGGTGRWLQKLGIGYAYAELGEHCGDLGGPEDQELVNDIGRFLSGQLEAEDGTVLDGVTGDVAAYAADENAGLLLAAATGAAPFRFAAVAATGAITDKHDQYFSEGNVARAQPLLQLGRDAALCELPQAATDPAVTGFWQSRDMTRRSYSLDVPTLLVHDGASPFELGQTLDLWQALRIGDDVRPEPVQRWLRLDARDPGVRWGDPTSGTALLDVFIGAHLLRGPEGAALRSDLNTRPRVELAAGAFGCSVPVTCDGSQASLAVKGGPGTVDGVVNDTLFLNRTFEQDFDCTPVCVPGPGTGEVGTLEDVNLFTPPHAPVFSWADAGADSETLTADDPLNDGSGIAGQEALPGGHGYHSLYFATDPAPAATGIVGRAVLDGFFDTPSPGGTITPILLDVDTQGQTTVISRGALDLDYADARSRDVHIRGWKPARVVFDGIVHRLGEGHRLAVVLQSQNIDHYEAGAPQGLVSVATGPVGNLTTTGSVLHVPLLPKLGADSVSLGR